MKQSRSDETSCATTTLTGFRAGLHQCWTSWPDAAFELTDTVLCMPSPVASVPALSLEPAFRRSHGSLYKALARGEVDDEAMRELLVEHRSSGWPLVFAVDASAGRPRAALPCLTYAVLQQFSSSRLPVGLTPSLIVLRLCAESCVIPTLFATTRAGFAARSLSMYPTLLQSVSPSARFGSKLSFLRLAPGIPLTDICTRLLARAI